MWRANATSGPAPQLEAFDTTSWGQHDVGHCQSSMCRVECAGLTTAADGPDPTVCSPCVCAWLAPVSAHF